MPLVLPENLLVTPVAKSEEQVDVRAVVLSSAGRRGRAPAPPVSTESISSPAALQGLTVANLRAVAVSAGVELPSSLSKKADLVQHLERALFPA